MPKCMDPLRFAGRDYRRIPLPKKGKSVVLNDEKNALVWKGTIRLNGLDCVTRMHRRLGLRKYPFLYVINFDELYASTSFNPG